MIVNLSRVCDLIGQESSERVGVLVVPGGAGILPSQHPSGFGECSHGGATVLVRRRGLSTFESF